MYIQWSTFEQYTNFFEPLQMLTIVFAFMIKIYINEKCHTETTVNMFER